MRLAFPISTVRDPDTLLRDEMINVGDTAAAPEATVRLKSLIDEAHILMLASHDPAVLRRLATARCR